MPVLILNLNFDIFQTGQRLRRGHNLTQHKQDFQVCAFFCALTLNNKQMQVTVENILWNRFWAHLCVRLTSPIQGSD